SCWLLSPRLRPRVRPCRGASCSTSSLGSLSSFSGCCGRHRDLHSFPTRRSSDLRTAGVGVRDSARRGAAAATDGARAGAPSTARSEEHTSELQSRENLVCRLLLAKKNFRPHAQTGSA